MIVRFTVPGQPVTQGSMAAVKTKGGKVKVIHSKKGKCQSVAQWRRVAKQAAHLAMRGRALMDGAVEVYAVFYVERPVSREGEPFPIWRLDLDKLERALGDALTGIVVTDDVRIVFWSARKSYADLHPQGIPCTVVGVKEAFYEGRGMS